MKIIVLQIMLGAGGVFSFLIAMRQFINWLRYRNKLQKVSATIVRVDMAAAPTMKVINSKWAEVSYDVQGKRYIAERRVQVPLDSEVGEHIIVWYVCDKPQVLYMHSNLMMILLFIERAVKPLVLAMGI